MKQFILLFLSTFLSSCSFIHYMNTKEKLAKSESEISEYLDAIYFKTFNYSIQIKSNYLEELEKEKHFLDLNKKENNIEQSTMQIRVYDSTGNLVTAYTQCYGNLNRINILEKKDFVKYGRFPNNYKLRYEDESELLNITSDEKNKLINASSKKNRIVIYWNIWSNYYSKIMLRKTKKYVKKFDPEMNETFILLLNNDI